MIGGSTISDEKLAVWNKGSRVYTFLSRVSREWGRLLHFAKLGGMMYNVIGQNSENTGSDRLITKMEGFLLRNP